MSQLNGKCCTKLNLAGKHKDVYFTKDGFKGKNLVLKEEEKEDNLIERVIEEGLSLPVTS